MLGEASDPSEAAPQHTCGLSDPTATQAPFLKSAAQPLKKNQFKNSAAHHWLRPSAAPNKPGPAPTHRAEALPPSTKMAAGRRGRAEVPCWGADASIMAAAAASPALKRLDLRDPAALFETHGAEEIRGLERQVRAEIEHKKEELRQMVGERYRDLIEAADTIGHMRRCAAGLVDAVRATDQYCARLRRAGSAAPRPPRDPQVSPAPVPRPGGEAGAPAGALPPQEAPPPPPAPAAGVRHSCRPPRVAGRFPAAPREPPGLQASPPSPQSWGRRASFLMETLGVQPCSLFPDIVSGTEFSPASTTSPPRSFLPPAPHPHSTPRNNFQAAKRPATLCSRSLEGSHQSPGSHLLIEEQVHFKELRC